jgi:hypothetical protein
MKIKLPPMSRAKQQKIKKQIIDETREAINDEVRDREYMAGTRAEMMFLLATALELNLGKKRIQRIINRVNSMLPDLSQDKADGVMDELLISRLRHLGLIPEAIFPEYFEAKERFERRNEEEQR